MKPCQAELWERLTGDLEELDLYRQCQTPRQIEAERLLREMSARFKATLADEQQKAFYSLMSIANTVRWDSQDTGIVLGLFIAKELRNFLDHPLDALQQASAFHSPLLKTEARYIKTLRKYFKKLIRK